ncbi:MAG TPA: hypothetical protein VGP25_18070 [Gemmatimonadaceae bacterium]|nr:hypothetical protein [Gemmatimonadaceae bacterium]
MKSSSRTIRLALLAALFLAMPTLASSASAQAATCLRADNCLRLTTFDATVTDFRTSPAEYGGKLITATVRFTNRTDRPLTLGYVNGSGVSLDDRGNRFVVYGNGAVRGIGEISQSTFDPKFTLRPGESSDARFELLFRPATRGIIMGTSYDLDLTVRQIDQIAGGQFRLGREHSLHFRGFGGEGATTASTSGAAPAPAPAGEPLTAPAPASQGVPLEADQCAGRPRCYSAGTFVAEVSQMTAGVEGRHHVLRSVVRFRNMSNQPIILGYKGTSSGATDNLGNRYYYGRAGTHDVSVQGMEILEGRAANAQFQLAPGQSREARFATIRFEVGGKQIGTSFNEDMTIVLLEPLPGNQIRVGREFAVSFHDLTSGAGDNARAAGNAVAGEAAKKLFDAFRNRGKKP